MSKQIIYLVFTVDAETKAHNVFCAYADEMEAKRKATALEGLLKYAYCFVLKTIMEKTP